MLSLADAQQQLSVINAAIAEYYAGTRRRSLKLGGKEFNREIINQDIKIEALLQERMRLQAIVDSWQPPQVVLFRGNTSFPLIVTKKPTDTRPKGVF